MRLAGRARACVRLGARARPRSGAVHAEFRAALGIRVRLRGAACASPWTISIRSKSWPEVFRGREIFVRIDPGFGRGHHHHVRTAGRALEIRRARRRGGRARRARPRSRGPRRGTACAHRQRHPRCRQLDRDRQCCSRSSRGIFPTLRSSIWAAESAYRNKRGRAGSISPRSMRGLRISSGNSRGSSSGWSPDDSWWRKAGVLVAVVTQLKSKGEVRYVGIATGHELADPSGALRSTSRYPQSDRASMSR